MTKTSERCSALQRTEASGEIPISSTGNVVVDDDSKAISVAVASAVLPCDVATMYDCQSHVAHSRSSFTCNESAGVSRLRFVGNLDKDTKLAFPPIRGDESRELEDIQASGAMGNG